MLSHRTISMMESFVYVVTVSSGVYSVKMDPRTGKYILSKWNIIFGFIHLLIFTFSLIAVFWYNAREILWPLMSKSNAEVICNFGIRVLDIALSYLVLIRTIYVSKMELDDFNRFSQIEECVESLGLPGEDRNQKVQIYSFVVFVMLIIHYTIGVWNMISFFRMVTGRSPSLQYCIMMSLAKCYQTHYTFKFIKYSYMKFVLDRDIRKHVTRLCQMSREEFERNEHIFDRPGQKC